MSLGHEQIAMRYQENYSLLNLKNVIGEAEFSWSCILYFN